MHYFHVMQHKDFSENLRRLRKEKGWTQIDLAKKLKCTQGMITAYETGRRVPTLERLTIMSNLFGVHIDQILGRSDKSLPANEQVKSPKLLKKFEELQQLPPADRRAVFKMIDALVQKNKK